LEGTEATACAYVKNFLCFALFIFNDSSQTIVIPKSTGPIFAKFSGSVELWLPMISLKLVFESVKGRRHGNHFYCRCAQAASGAVGRANVWLYRTSTWHGIGGVAVLTEAQVKRRH